MTRTRLPKILILVGEKMDIRATLQITATVNNAQGKAVRALATFSADALEWIVFNLDDGQVPDGNSPHILHKVEIGFPNGSAVCPPAINQWMNIPFSCMLIKREES